LIQPGLSSNVERRGRVFHVQTESFDRDVPVIETRIYSGGEVLVRMTASLAELAERNNLTGDDLWHAVELQHWNLIRKVKLGLLGDEPPEPVASETGLRRGHRPPSPVSPVYEDLSFGELLNVLKQRTRERRRRSTRTRPIRPVAAAPSRPRGWWRRVFWPSTVVVRW
jgi:hypothetical protein